MGSRHCPPPLPVSQCMDYVRLGESTTIKTTAGSYATSQAVDQDPDYFILPQRRLLPHILIPRSERRMPGVPITYSLSCLNQRDNLKLPRASTYGNEWEWTVCSSASFICTSSIMPKGTPQKCILKKRRRPASRQPGEIHMMDIIPGNQNGR